MPCYRLSVLALILAASLGGGAVAHDRPGLYLDPELLPPDTRPGECVIRRVTGPGGAYRWERIECEGGWNGYDRWDYGQPLDVQVGPPRGDRYSDRYDGPAHGGWDDGYWPPYPVYRVAGRDEDGFLVWPGKRP